MALAIVSGMRPLGCAVAEQGEEVHIQPITGTYALYLELAIIANVRGNDFVSNSQLLRVDAL